MRDWRSRNNGSSQRFLKYSKRMERKYIVQVSFSDKRIITFDKNPNSAVKRARKRGFKCPFIFFNSKPTDVMFGGMYYEVCANGMLKPIK